MSVHGYARRHGAPGITIFGNARGAPTPRARVAALAELTSVGGDLLLQAGQGLGEELLDLSLRHGVFRGVNVNGHLRGLAGLFDLRPPRTYVFDG